MLTRIRHWIESVSSFFQEEKKDYFAIYTYPHGTWNMWFSAKSNEQAIEMAQTIILEKCKKEMREDPAPLHSKGQEKDAILHSVAQGKRGEVRIFSK